MMTFVTSDDMLECALSLDYKRLLNTCHILNV